MAKQEFTCYDNPESRDFQFQDFAEFSEGDETKQRPKKKVTVWNQGGSKACTMYSGTHIVNGNNILEDIKLGITRDQVDPMTLRTSFCQDRGYDNVGSSIQTIGLRLKKRGLIEGFVTIPATGEEEVLVRQMRKAIDMGNFLSTGSAFGDRTTIKKTGVYSERADRQFTGHGRAIIGYEGDYFWAINSYGDKRGPYNGYFKVPNSMVNKIYSKLAVIDKADIMFGKFAEIQKLKQGVELLRQVYKTTKEDGYIKYMDKIDLGQNISEIYGVII